MASRSKKNLNEILVDAYEKACEEYAMVYPNLPQPFLTCTHRSFDEQAELFHRPHDGKDNNGNGIIDDKGEKVIEKAADVYIWEDYQIDYFVSSGKQLGRVFLTDLDKEFTKATAGLTRVFELKELDEYGRTVPLGMWRYRFVWDFGNGVYSAPSAEMLVPDMLWSAVPDDELQKSIDDTVKDYQRPRKIGERYDLNDATNISEFADTLVPDIASLYNTSLLRHKPAYPPIIYQDGTNYIWTKLGDHFYNIKEILYKDKKHRFGVNATKAQYLQFYRTADTDLIGRKKFADFTTMLTSFFSKSSAKLHGAIYEGVEIGINQDKQGDWLNMVSIDDLYYYINDSDERVTPRVNIPGVYIAPHFAQLVVPIFKSNDQQYTYNSLFDDEGRLRTVYNNGYIIQNQIVFPGTYPMLGVTETTNFAGFVGREKFECFEYNRLTAQVTQVHNISYTKYLNIIVASPPLIHYSKHGRHQDENLYLIY